MNNAARPSVRGQLHKEALRIIDFVEPIPEGYDEWGTPLWHGISLAAWERLAQDKESLLALLNICRMHFPTAAAVLLKVKSKGTGGLIPFIFNRAQAIIWNRIAGMIAKQITLFICVLKARQLGISTFVLAWSWWNMWRLEDSEVLAVGNTDKLIQAFVDAFRRFHDELPNIEGVRPKLRADNSRGGRVPKREMYYADRRTKLITVVDKSVDTRGLAAPNQHYSEFAFYVNPEELLLTLLPMLPRPGTLARRNASIFIESTPNGKNYFYDFWQLAKSGESDWQAIFIPWTVAEDECSLEPPANWRLTRELEEIRQRLTHERRKIDGRDVTKAQMYWREVEMANQGWNEDKFEQENPGDDETCFLLRSKSIFKEYMRFLQKCVQNAERDCVAEFAKRRIPLEPGTQYVRGELIHEPGPGPFDEWTAHRLESKFQRADDGRLLMFSPPQHGHSYCIGIDTSQGVGRDASVGWVLDVTTGKQAALWYSNTTEEEPFADEMAALGYYYNTALLYPEVNSIGRSVMKRLKRVWMYPRVGLEEKWDEPGLKPGKYGYMMNDDLKDELVRKLRYFIKERYLAIADGKTLSEMTTFEQVGEKSYEAASGAHDDCVIAAGLACMAVHQTPRFYAAMTQNRHEAAPSAYDLGLSRQEPAAALPITANATDDAFRDMPADIRKVLESSRRAASSIPTNPIRGF